MVYDDLYWDFEALKAANVYGTDYHVLAGVKNPKVIYTAIHGGGIETGTTELAIFSAGTKDSYYCFEGFKPSGNSVLHVTSTHFDEPNGRQLVAASDYTISYHGYSDSAVKNTKIGGLDTELKEAILDSLIAAGFNAELEDPADSVIPGVEPENIANCNRRKMGVQLEISTLQRTSIFGTNTRLGRRLTVNAEFNKYVKAINDAVASVVTK
jgi:phage replication-related protein YjqB (UPF0714/DUF867 family)